MLDLDRTSNSLGRLDVQMLILVAKHAWATQSTIYLLSVTHCTIWFPRLHHVVSQDYPVYHMVSQIVAKEPLFWNVPEVFQSDNYQAHHVLLFKQSIRGLSIVSGVLDRIHVYKLDSLSLRASDLTTSFVFIQHLCALHLSFTANLLLPLHYNTSRNQVSCRFVIVC